MQIHKMGEIAVHTITKIILLCIFSHRFPKLAITNHDISQYSERRERSTSSCEKNEEVPIFINSG